MFGCARRGAHRSQPPRRLHGSPDRDVGGQLRQSEQHHAGTPERRPAVPALVRRDGATGRVPRRTAEAPRRLISAGLWQGPGLPDRRTVSTWRGTRSLAAACQDGTDTGLRDELFVRLGVSGWHEGERRALHLTVGSVRRTPDLCWIGKANRHPCTAVAGPQLVDLIGRYLRPLRHRPRSNTRRRRPTVLPDGPRPAPGPTPPGIGHHHDGGPAGATRATEPRWPKSAMSPPHDLKRTAARMMHEARSLDGGHLFDLLDIADVLDHDNPKVTKDCYDRAARQRQQAASSGPAPGSDAGYLPARRCQRVRFSIFLCFFLRIRLRRFLMRLPISLGKLTDHTPPQPTDAAARPASGQVHTDARDGTYAFLSSVLRRRLECESRRDAQGRQPEHPAPDASKQAVGRSWLRQTVP